MLRISAAFGAEFDGGDFVLIKLFLAILLFDLPLDGQAVAIPTGHIRRVFAQQCLRANNHVLQNMVQRVADMHVAIRIRRAIMQNELLTPTAAIAQLRIKILRLPTRENARLLLRKAGLHREICFRQENGVAIVDRVSHVKSALSAKMRRIETSLSLHACVIPANAGIHGMTCQSKLRRQTMDPRSSRG